MQTSINGKEAEWSPEIRALWNATADGRPHGKLISANYFTPRPYRNEYDQGSRDEGFTYTVKQGYQHRVFQTKVTEEMKEAAKA